MSKERISWEGYEIVGMSVLGFILEEVKEVKLDNDLLNTSERFLEVARRWQEYHTRTPASAVKKLKEEIEEFEAEEEGTLAKLDEAGDVLTLAFRLMWSLSRKDLEFALRVSEMKADRRFSTGIKDKEAEREEAQRIADEIWAETLEEDYYGT